MKLVDSKNFSKSNNFNFEMYAVLEYIALLEKSRQSSLESEYLFCKE